MFYVTLLLKSLIVICHFDWIHLSFVNSWVSRHMFPIPSMFSSVSLALSKAKFLYFSTRFLHSNTLSASFSFLFHSCSHYYIFHYFSHYLILLHLSALFLSLIPFRFSSLPSYFCISLSLPLNVSLSFPLYLSLWCYVGRVSRVWTKVSVDTLLMTFFI